MQAFFRNFQKFFATQYLPYLRRADSGYEARVLRNHETNSVKPADAVQYVLSERLLLRYRARNHYLA